MKPFTLTNGIKVFLVEQHALPIVSMDLNFDGGGRRRSEGQGRPRRRVHGDADRGHRQARQDRSTPKRSPTSRRTISAYATDDSHGVALVELDQAPRRDVRAVRRHAAHARAAREDFDRMIKRRIEGVKQARGNPALGRRPRHRRRCCTAPAHPFGGVVTEDVARAITLDDCKTYVATWLKPKHARLFVVGDLDRGASAQALRVRPRSPRGPVRHPKLARAAGAEDDDGPDLLRRHPGRRAVAGVAAAVRSQAHRARLLRERR